MHKISRSCWNLQDKGRMAPVSRWSMSKWKTLPVIHSFGPKIWCGLTQSCTWPWKQIRPPSIVMEQRMVLLLCKWERIRFMERPRSHYRWKRAAMYGLTFMTLQEKKLLTSMGISRKVFTISKFACHRHRPISLRHNVELNVPASSWWMPDMTMATQSPIPA